MNKDQHTMKKQLGLHLSLSLFLYTILGIALSFGLQFLFSKINVELSEWFHLRIDILFILYLILGFACIFKYYWTKAWRYSDEMIARTKTTYEHTANEAENKKNELVMYLAHDIRTPLTTVIGYLSLLHEAPDMPEPQKEKYVKVALNKAERLEKLINELFEITKYNANTVVLKKEPVDLHFLIAQVIDEMYPILSANGNTALFEAGDNLLIEADSEKLARVFSNLLRNAATYSYPNTEISISAKQVDTNIQIVFRNHGKSISADQLNSIFEKFNRLDEARLSDTGGSGLGLSIAKEIIHLHGGTLNASSENEIISFTIILPASSLEK